MGLSYTDLDLSPYADQKALAVGVSGGPDSLALAWLLKDWAAAQNIELHILTVDHGLRVESADEARQVGGIVADWPAAIHAVLSWEGEKPETRVLEEARGARYRLMRDYCLTHGITHLFLAHHQDDQAETFLMRLAKGSGLDGLAAMRAEQIRDGITLVRPLLHVAKDDLVALCEENNLPYVRDSTNEKTDYLRPRLRAARAALEEEGLTAKRLATTAARLARARAALEEMTHRALITCVQTHNEESLSFHREALCAHPEEIVLRVILGAMDKVRASSNPYPPRLEKVEELVRALKAGRLDKSTTLGGCLFVPDAGNGLLWIKREA